MGRHAARTPLDGTLGGLARGIDDARLGSPAVILVGGAIGAACAQRTDTDPDTAAAPMSWAA